MDLELIYYAFPIHTIGGLVVEVTSGDTVEYGSRNLPFVADGEMNVGDIQTFTASFVLHVPGKSSVEVTAAAPDPTEVEVQAASVPDDEANG